MTPGGARTGRRTPLPSSARSSPRAMLPSFFYALALAAAQLVAGPTEYCMDCNLPVDDGCKCVCYSGGYDPDDPACQF